MERPNLSYETKSSGAKEVEKLLIFLVQLTTSRSGNHTCLIHTLLKAWEDRKTFPLLCVSPARPPNRCCYEPLERGSTLKINNPNVIGSFIEKYEHI